MPYPVVPLRLCLLVLHLVEIVLIKKFSLKKKTVLPPEDVTKTQTCVLFVFRDCTHMTGPLFFEVFRNDKTHIFSHTKKHLGVD